MRLLRELAVLIESETEIDLGVKRIGCLLINPDAQAIAQVIHNRARSIKSCNR